MRWPTFKTRVFARWARKEGMADRVLLAAVAEMESGLVDARLGGGLFKKRVGLPGSGKRGGALLELDWAGLGQMIESGKLLEVKDG